MSDLMPLERQVPMLCLRAPAKLNLFLDILGKRADGYHEIVTVMVALSLHDTLRFTEESSGEIRLRVHHAARSSRAGAEAGGEVPKGRDNLVVQAAELVRQACGVTRGVTIDLFKRIPTAAGLAGGSSDAATTLIGLNRFWSLNRSRSDLADWAARLGSDVGFFLSPTGAALCRGRGEQVQPLCLPQALHFVIARPASGLSTALVYRHCRPSAAPRPVEPLLESLRQGRLKRAANEFYNALEEPAQKLNPDVVRLNHQFAKQPMLGHQMSGSGTSHFGLCSTRRQALLVAARLRAAGSGQVFVGHSRPPDSMGLPPSPGIRLPVADPRTVRRTGRGNQ